MRYIMVKYSKNILIAIILIVTTFSTNAQNYSDYITIRQDAIFLFFKGNYYDAYKKFSLLEDNNINKPTNNDVDFWQKKCINQINSEIESTKKITDAMFFYKNKYALAYKNRKYGYINKLGETTIDFNYTFATPFNSKTGFATVFIEDDFFLIDTNGNRLNLAERVDDLNKGVEVVDFSNRNLTEILDELFLYDNVRILILSNNQIETLPKDIELMKNLEAIYLNNNKLKTIPQEIFNLPKLNTLNLSANKINHLPNISTNNSRNLTNLDLSENYISEIPEDIFNITSLTSLNLGFNRITDISENISHLNNLKHLTISNNLISEIPDEFENLTNLTHLDISKNKISDIKTLYKLIKLKVLNLSTNKIEKVSKKILNLNKLEHLDLSKNPIDTKQKSKIEKYFKDSNCIIVW